MQVNGQVLYHVLVVVACFRPVFESLPVARPNDGNGDGDDDDDRDSSLASQSKEVKASSRATSCSSTCIDKTLVQRTDATRAVSDRDTTDSASRSSGSLLCINGAYEAIGKSTISDRADFIRRPFLLKIVCEEDFDDCQCIVHLDFFITTSLNH